MDQKTVLEFITMDQKIVLKVITMNQKIVLKLSGYQTTVSKPYHIKPL
jgi:hypothetical protein